MPNLELGIEAVHFWVSGQRKGAIRNQNKGTQESKDTTQMAFSSSKVKCLIVDDDEAIREICSAVARSIGLECFEAASAEDALSVVKHARPSLLLTALILPGTPALDLIDQARELSPNLQIAVMTAHLSFGCAVEAVRLRAYDYILKPFTIDGLKALLSRMRDNALDAACPSMEHQLSACAS